jgi:hypothetical protein
MIIKSHLPHVKAHAGGVRAFLRCRRHTNDTGTGGRFEERRAEKAVEFKVPDVVDAYARVGESERERERESVCVCACVCVCVCVRLSS